MKNSYTTILAGLLLLAFSSHALAQHSVARQWNEALLGAIRKDLARPTVHARNLFHVSMAMYDAWAAYDSIAEPFLLGKAVGTFSCGFNGVPAPSNLQAAREEAISYAAYRILRFRFQNSPNAATTLPQFDALMAQLGYSTAFVSTNYASGTPAALGNYIAQCVINFGLQDGANEQNGYANQFYQPVNPPLVIKFPGNPSIIDPNRWQPLTLDVFIDQSGNVIPFNTPPFLSPEWGNVVPFSLKPSDLTVYQRGGKDYWVYHDPGPPPYLDTTAVGGISEEYKWGFSLVAVWSGQMDPNDTTMWDISPASIGNTQEYPTDFPALRNFYNLLEGGDPSPGHPLNPRTGLPYEPQIVPRGDYTRVLAEFWADGPNSETPPGHWFTILNYISDHPQLIKKFKGKGAVLNDLEWDIKSYFMLGGAMHDVAVTAWGIKGWYDYVRPVGAIRKMADLGQSTDPELPSFHPGGIPLIPGHIELVDENDPLAGPNFEHVDKIKLFAWRGPTYIQDPNSDIAHCGWILAENWWPYQRPSFVTPPFAGYISGHSTYSRAAAELLTQLTGDPFFPGGMGEFPAPKNEFLVFEKGPSTDLVLQWATYRDASDQCSLSRIWGGIHPPADDMPGRHIGMEIGNEAFDFALKYFYKDEDGDGFVSLDDCDDSNPAVYPGAPEICDKLDNNCNGMTDEGIFLFTYYLDQDGDSYGTTAMAFDTCAAIAPAGFSANSLDCDDSNPDIFPGAAEICDQIDNDCNGMIDDNIQIYTYFLDMDGDSYGTDATTFDTCATDIPAGYVANSLDCDDTNPEIHPGAMEICDTIDNNCNGTADEGLPLNTYYLDLDGDSFGTSILTLAICSAETPPGYANNNLDCDDTNPDVNPDATEVPDGLDNDCNGLVDDGVSSAITQIMPKWKLFPNPAREVLMVMYPYSGKLTANVMAMDGRLVQTSLIDFTNHTAVLNLSNLPSGMYVLNLTNAEGSRLVHARFVRF
ncbi:MAG: T9SS type A sorting domain-containing protein [Lewinellaceae bacterium]|nr:T9SS type A sorting domain-containing protein [Lewinellaceae bacterium]